MYTNKQYQIISITGKRSHISRIALAFHDCGFKTKISDKSVSYDFNADDFATVIVAVLGAGGINAIINNIIQHYKKHVKIKIENEQISELEIEGSMKEAELENLIKEIKDVFKNNSDPMKKSKLTKK